MIIVQELDMGVRVGWPRSVCKALCTLVKFYHYASCFTFTFILKLIETIHLMNELKTLSFETSTFKASGLPIKAKQHFFAFWLTSVLHMGKL